MTTPNYLLGKTFFDAHFNELVDFEIVVQMPFLGHVGPAESWTGAFARLLTKALPFPAFERLKMIFDRVAAFLHRPVSHDARFTQTMQQKLTKMINILVGRG